MPRYRQVFNEMLNLIYFPFTLPENFLSNQWHLEYIKLPPPGLL